MDSKGFVKEHKVAIISGVVLLLFGGVVLAGLLSRPSEPVKQMVKSVESTTNPTTKSSEEMVIESQAEALLHEDVKTAEQVAVIEKALGEVKDTAVKTQLTAKLNEAKQKVVAPETKAVAQQIAQPKADESSQPATQQPQVVQQPIQPQPTQAPVQTQRQTQAPVQTTQVPTTTTRKVVETTQATTKRYRINSLGNSGREFKSYDEAMNWGYEQQLIVKKGYWVYQVDYSDGTSTFTVEWN